MARYGERAHGYKRVRGRQIATASTAVIQLIATPGNPQRLVISKITVSNVSDTDSEVHILSGTEIIWTIPAPRHGGACEVYPDPLECNPDEALNFQCADSVTKMTVSAAGVAQAA